MSKREKKFAILFTILDVILIGVIAFFFFQLDRKAPKMDFSPYDVAYSVDMDMNELLVGVSATDNKDGDVTGRIVIEKIVESKTDNTVVVYYAVSDRAGNVAKASRVVKKA